MNETILFPTAHDYHVDTICKQIVHTLYERQCAVKGVKVLFTTYTNENDRFIYINHIAIPHLDVELEFDRNQGYIDHNRYNTAAVGTLAIPRKLLNLYGDHSGPIFYTYVGLHWSEEKDEFLHGFKVNSRLHKEPRTYLKYRGQGLQLVHDNDLGREYEPQGKEPYSYSLDEVMSEYNAYLGARALPYIIQAPTHYSPKQSTITLPDYWQGDVTEENITAIAQKLCHMLIAKNYTFHDGWSSSPHQKVIGQSVATSESRYYGTSITVTDTYGLWSIHTHKTHITFAGTTVKIHHFAPGGNELNWTITTQA
jgi:hypothetical protein